MTSNDNSEEKEEEEDHDEEKEEKEEEVEDFMTVKDGLFSILVLFVFLHSMVESSYDVLFGKVARKVLFEEYYASADEFMASLMLRPPEDPNVDFAVRV